jgi:hypothetical protein
MKKTVYGRGRDSNIGFGVSGADQNGAFAVSNVGGAVALPPVGMHDLDGISFQLKTAAGVRTIVVTAADNVVAGTHTWTFANGAFTADDVGGTLTVSGASQANNNATVTISSVTNATTIVTTGTQTNETFTTPTNLTVTVTGAAMNGTWTIEASNDYASGELGQSDAAGAWTDITASFVTISAVVGVQTKFTMSTIPILSARYVRAKLTPTAVGRALASANVYAKGNG